MDTLVGYTYTDWMKLLRENRFSVGRKYRSRSLTITSMSLMNSVHRRKEMRLYEDEIRKASVQSPIFILGHWRSGTTLLHNLITQDKQFAFPSLFQTTHPHTFLIREEMAKKMMADAEEQKRHMDNVQINFESPGEDEPALAVLSLCSPVLGWVFPKSWSRYSQFLTFRHSNPKDKKKWVDALDFFSRKLTLRYKKALVFKSPPHLARMSIIHENFPDAKFIHIYRNPYHVYQSTMRLFEKVLPEVCLQEDDVSQYKDRILRDYQVMYDAFFDDLKTIPSDKIWSLSFEQLESNMVEQVCSIYEGLQLPDFDKFQPKLESYVDSISDYKKNPYPDLPDDEKIVITKSWERNFDQWQYPL